MELQDFVPCRRAVDDLRQTELEGSCASSSEDRLQILLHFPNGLEHPPERSVRVDVSKVVGGNRLAVAHEDRMDLAVGETSNEITCGLPQFPE